MVWQLNRLRLSLKKLEAAEKFCSFRIEVGLISKRAACITFKQSGMLLVAAYDEQACLMDFALAVSALEVLGPSSGCVAVPLRLAMAIPSLSRGSSDTSVGIGSSVSATDGESSMELEKYVVQIFAASSKTSYLELMLKKLLVFSVKQSGFCRNFIRLTRRFCRLFWISVFIASNNVAQIHILPSTSPARESGRSGSPIIHL